MRKSTALAHLHLHTEASLIDGLGTVSRTVSAAAKIGAPALAMTDHGTLANAIAFSQSCESHGVKPIMGLEAYVTRDGKRFHLTLLADGQRGFKTLTELNNIGQASNDASKPSFDLSLLKEHNGGLVVLSGCPASPLQDLAWADSKNIAIELKSIFGSRLFAEIMFVSNQAPWERSAKLIRDLGLKGVVTNDVHFAYKDDAKIHNLLTQMKAGFEYDSRTLFLTTPEQMRERVNRIAPGYREMLEKGMRNANRLARMLGSVKLKSKPQLPHIEDAPKMLKFLCEQGLAEKGLSKNEAYRDRMNYEISVINGMDFAGYFIIFKDIVDYAKSSGIWVGPGRGSAAGSLVSYLLSITDIDPLRFDLSFERFLNFKRKDMPDIDVDFETERRGDVLEYASKKWGAMQVATYSRFSHKSLVHDLARSFRIDRALDQDAADGGVDSKAFKVMSSRNPLIKPAYDAMIGQMRHIGRHPGGIIIVEKGVPVPLIRTSNGDLVAAWTEGDNKELSEAGIVKLDILSVSAGSIIRRLEEKHGFKAPELEDGDLVFELFCKGDTLGIFQFAGSQGIIEFTKEVQPRTMQDLIAINALYRPGALDSGTAWKFPKWKHSPRKIHPLVDDILEQTGGIIAYQEQLMKIIATMTSDDSLSMQEKMANADIARKLIIKSKPDDPEWNVAINKLHAGFRDGCAAHGITKKIAKELWSEIITYARYGFVKAHSTAYAFIAASMAWWKYHYPADFYAEMLTVDNSEWERFLFEVIARGIEVVPPHVNRSTSEFVSDGKKVFMPLNIVKFLAGKGSSEIETQGPFKSLEDYMTRVSKRAVNKRARTGLVYIGAFEGIISEDGRPIHEVLDIDEIDETKTVTDRQKEFMGLILPTTKVLNAIEKAKANGYVGGIVIDAEERSSKYGPYIVYTLMPEGKYWSRRFSFSPGQEVKLKVSKKTGKILKFTSLL